MVFYSYKSIRLRKERGFTLIELLVVISVLAILGAFGFAALVNYDRQQTLKTAARDLRTHLRLAQNKAVVQEKPSTGCPQLTGYRLQFATSQRYNIYRLCSGVPDVSIREFNLPSEISKTGADEEVTFRAGAGTIDTQVTFTLTSTLISGSETITITQQGVIQ